MTKRELIEMLDDVPADAEVKIALQPDYPLAAKISNVCIDRRKPDDPIAWLAAGNATEYGERRFWDEYDIDEDAED